MKCFYSDAQAVGVCKSCGRGLSREFAVEYPKGLACRGRCEQDVQALIAMIDRSTNLSATSASITRSNAMTLLVSALFFLFMAGAFLMASSSTRGFQLGLYLGVAFLAYGCYGLFRANRVRKAAGK